MLAHGLGAGGNTDGLARQPLAAILLPVGDLASVGRAVRFLRERAGISQAEAAAAAHLAPSVVNRTEMGRQAPTVGTLEALLAAVGATLHDLADALDVVNGRTPPAGRGKPSPHRVAAIAAQGQIDRAFLTGWIADALDFELDVEQELANLSATVAAAAQAIFDAEVKRVRDGIAAAEAQSAQRAGVETRPPPNRSGR